MEKNEENSGDRNDAIRNDAFKKVPDELSEEAMEKLRRLKPIGTVLQHRYEEIAIEVADEWMGSMREHLLLIWFGVLAGLVASSGVMVLEIVKVPGEVYGALFGLLLGFLLSTSYLFFRSDWFKMRQVDRLVKNTGLLFVPSAIWWEQYDRMVKGEISLDEFNRFEGDRLRAYRETIRERMRKKKKMK